MNIFTHFQYLDKIGQIFFGLPPPKAQSQGLLGKFIFTTYNLVTLPFPTWRQFLVAMQTVNQGFVVNQFVLHANVLHLQHTNFETLFQMEIAWEDCCVECWCEKTRKCMSRWTGRRDITEKLLKTALNINQSIKVEK